ncbi:MAG: hypothetical protein DMG92_01330 [Acidobacteria bacterium]|nr:MAG: hypothetical protein DMG92_01330 [Acidobacteriota bacterium]
MQAQSWTVNLVGLELGLQMSSKDELTQKCGVLGDEVGMCWRTHVVGRFDRRLRRTLYCRQPFRKR